MLKPKVKDPDVVHERLQYYKNLQKKSYDRGSRNLPVLNQGDVVRIRGEKGFLQKGVVERKSKYPRSYLVKSPSGTYRRNRRHLLKVEEPMESSHIEMDYNIGTTNLKPSMVEEELTNNERVQPRRQIVSRQNNGTDNGSLNVYTRSGRLVKRPERLDL